MPEPAQHVVGVDLGTVIGIGTDFTACAVLPVLEGEPGARAAMRRVAAAAERIAGQGGIGDMLAWYVEHGVPPSCHEQARELGISVHEHLAALGAGQAAGGHGVMALDWWSGNRSVLVDQQLSGVLVGMTLASRPHEIYRALVEATAFGTRRIIDAFNDAGVRVRELIAVEGLLENDWLMQCYADVVGMPINLIGPDPDPDPGPAPGSAVPAGRVYEPVASRARAYDLLYPLYDRLHDHFGLQQRQLMRELRALRDHASGDAEP
jgi:L-ribulokinase